MATSAVMSTRATGAGGKLPASAAAATAAARTNADTGICCRRAAPLVARTPRVDQVEGAARVAAW